MMQHPPQMAQQPPGHIFGQTGFPPQVRAFEFCFHTVRNLPSSFVAVLPAATSPAPSVINVASSTSKSYDAPAAGIKRNLHFSCVTSVPVYI